MRRVHIVKYKICFLSVLSFLTPGYIRYAFSSTLDGQWWLVQAVVSLVKRSCASVWPWASHNQCRLLRICLGGALVNWRGSRSKVRRILTVWCEIPRNWRYYHTLSVALPHRKSNSFKTYCPPELNKITTNTKNLWLSIINYQLSIIHQSSSIILHPYPFSIVNRQLSTANPHLTITISNQQ